ncbi:hypothetical protein DL767_001493 [Monosporascus sp. MG133]|nr:hypothetical protein DL767_001493 [Monosporascus sp. MG133]
MADPAPLDPAAEAAATEAALAAARMFNITLWTLYAFGVLITALRTYARVKAVGWKHLEADDYLVWVAVLLYSTQSTLGYQIGNLAHGLANNGMTDAQRAALSPSDPEYDMRVIGSKIQVAGWSCYSTLMVVLKFAMLFFYLRLTNGLGSRYRKPVHIGFALVLAGYLASIAAVFLSCIPFYHYWQINPDPGNFCQAAVSRPIIWASFAANVSSDIYLILIPLPLLWGSRLRLVEKLASTLVLGAGIFVLVCATVKTVFVLKDDANGAELAGKWGTREAFVAVVTANLPMVFQLFKIWLRPLLGSSARNTNKQYNTPEGFQTIGGSGADDSRSHGLRETHGTKGTNPLTNVSFTESEERIVNTIKMQNMKTAASMAQGNQKDNKGIVVLTEFDISEGRSSQYEQNKRDHGFITNKIADAFEGYGAVIAGPEMRAFARSAPVYDHYCDFIKAATMETRKLASESLIRHIYGAYKKTEAPDRVLMLPFKSWACPSPRGHPRRVRGVSAFEVPRNSLSSESAPSAPPVFRQTGSISLNTKSVNEPRGTSQLPWTG